MGSSSPRAPPSRPAPKRRHVQDADRFYCPYPGCARSFAELWRLKVHYRAAPDVRGSGKERGHGAELKACPKCGEELKPGRHHVGCAAGKAKLHRRLVARSSKAARHQRRKRREVEYSQESDDEEESEEWESDEEEEEEEEEEVVASPRRRRKKARRRCAAPGTTRCGTTRHTQVMGTPTGTAVGVPAQWVPLDFGLFSQQNAGFAFSAPGMCPPAAAMAPPPAAAAPPMDDTAYSLLFCNQRNNMPTMATAQMGLGPDLDPDLDLAAIMDPDYGIQPGLGTKFEDINLELSPLQDILDADQPWEGAPTGKPNIHQAQPEPAMPTVKKDPLLDTFPLGFNDGGLLDSGSVPVKFGDTFSNDGFCDADGEILVQSGPVWEPLSTPMKDIGQYFMRGTSSKDFLADDHRLVNCPAQEMRTKDRVQR